MTRRFTPIDARNSSAARALFIGLPMLGGGAAALSGNGRRRIVMDERLT